MENQSLFRRIFNFFLKNWFISSAISIIPLLVSAYIDLWKPIEMPFYKKIILTIFIFLSVVFIIVKNICTSVDDKKRRNADNYYQSLTQRQMGTTGNIIENITSVISEGKYRNLLSESLDPFCNNRSRVNPCTRMRSFCEDAKNILSRHFDCAEADIGISIYVRNIVDEGNNAVWKFLFQTNVAEKDLNSKIVSESRDSAFNVVKDEVGTVFFKEKKNAEKERHYIMTEDEKNNGLKGNIYCENISIVDSNEKQLLPLVFCVTTYNTRICSDKDYFAVEKAKKLLSKTGLDVKYEIANLLLYQHMGFRKNLIQR